MVLSVRSFITILEIRRGIELVVNSRRKATLTTWLEEELLVRFRNRLVALDTAAVLTWETLTGRLERSGTPMPAIDSLIAATALHGNFTLVTRNVPDFKNAGVKLLNPWER